MNIFNNVSRGIESRKKYFEYINKQFKTSSKYDNLEGKIKKNETENKNKKKIIPSSVILNSKINNINKPYSKSFIKKIKYKSLIENFDNKNNCLVIILLLIIIWILKNIN